MTTSPKGLTHPQPGQACSCGSGQRFEVCCEPAIKGTRPAETAEQLMRSRFTAHVTRDYGYLHRTFLTTSRRPYRPEKDSDGLNWTRLVVHAHETGAQPDIAYVEFSASYEEEGVEQTIHEKSEFSRIDGEWFYTKAVRHGPAPRQLAQPKVGRNEPCPCGSGKKYKHCCA